MPRRSLRSTILPFVLIFLVFLLTGAPGWAQDTEVTPEPASEEASPEAPTVEAPTQEPATLTPEPTATPTDMPPTDMPPTDMPPTDAPPTDAPPPTATDLPTETPTEVGPPTSEPTLEPTAALPTETSVPTDVLATEEVTEAAPTPSPSPTATETPTETPTDEAFPPEPELTVLIDDNFDGGELFNWQLPDGWTLVASGDGQTLERSASSNSTGPALADLYNVVVEARVQIVAGAAEIVVRQSAAGEYAVVLSSNGYVVVYRAGAVIASGTTSVGADGDWRSLRVAAIDDMLTVRVDGEEVIALRDQAPLPAGQVALGGGQVRFDDVRVSAAADEAAALLAAMRGMVVMAVNTFTVNSTGNAGDANTADGVCQTATLNECTLRAAIQQANAASGVDTIAFAIPGAGVKRIVAPSLPAITDPVIIDGYTQPGAAAATDSGPATILIELYGVSDGEGGNGLAISAGGSTVRGLAIGRFNVGIAITGSGGNTIEGNYIGTDASGLFSSDNGNFSNRNTGVSVVGSPNNLIGGTTSAARNVISGNGQASVSIGQGILIDGVSATGNVIQGNYIGPNALGNYFTCCIQNNIGIVVSRAVNTTIGGTTNGVGNLISGNASVGISLTSNASNVTIQGNLIGTIYDGTVGMTPGNSSGVSIASGVTGAKIGGAEAGAGNVISGNRFDGIGIGANGTVVEGNFIGTDITGTKAIPNESDGISIAASNVWIGGPTAGARNVISGNGAYGVYISSASNLRVQGNYIGTDATGTGELGNTAGGIIFYSAGGHIGGTAAGEGNVIAYNGGNGVYVRSAGMRILGNSIFENAGLGIDQNPFVTNYPLLDTVIASGSDMLITGSFFSDSLTSQRVEFFASPVCDSVGRGGGRIFLGSTNVTPDSHGNGDFTNVSFPIQSGNLVITATVTNNGTATTSEFSNCLTVTTSTTVINTNDSGPGSLREAILVANASVGVVDTINFAIPGAGTKTIALAEALPEITDPVIIDATTQSGYAGTPRVELNGAGISGVADGLHISAGGSTVKGLAISWFSEDGIELVENGGNTIVGNYIGLGLDGTTDKGNGTEASGGGIYVNETSNNVIGGTTATARNVVSGNQRGIGIYGPNASGNVVRGNYIGTNAAGTAAVPNIFFGVALFDATGNTVGGTTAGARNVISGNAADSAGVWIQGVAGEASGNTILGNYIGLNAAGTADLGNGGWGIYIGAASDNLIGGTTAGARNVISGNAFEGIELAEGSSENSVQGNYIGLNAAGTAAIANDVTGVWIVDSSDNLIGGVTAGARNVISGNSNDAGVAIVDASSGNRVQGNYIGLNPAGMAAIGNELGVAILGAPNNQIGGTEAGAGNLISGNLSTAIYLSSANASGNVIQGNGLGLDAEGQARLGNGGNGIYVQGATNTLIGGTTAAARNTISRHQQFPAIGLDSGATGNQIQGNFLGTTSAIGGPQGGNYLGVYIENASNNSIGGAQAGAGNTIRDSVYGAVWIVSGTGNAVLGNSISANGLMSIELEPGGQNPNDSRDPDSGPNNLQNTPVLLSATDNAGTLVINGTLNTTPNMAVRVEFFADYGCSPGRANGVEYLGFRNFTTDSSGNVSFVVTFPYSGLPQISATATDAGNNTSEYATCAFVDNPVAPTAAPVLLAPASGAPVNDNTPSLSWNPVANASSYELQIGTSSSFSTVVFSTQGAFNEATPSTPLTDRTYYWRVRGRSSVGTGPWSSSRSFTVDTVAPGAPNLSSPANAALTSDTTPSLSWGSVSGANRYRVEIAVDENFTQAALAETQVTSTSLTLASPGLAQGVYYWRVQAGDAADNWGGESAVRSFRLFVGTEPADGAFTTDTTPTFKWVGISGASGYRLEVATDSAFSSMVAGYPLDVGAVTSYTIPNNKALPAGDTYYWRILRRLPTLETPQAGVFRTLFLVTTTPGAPVLADPANAAFLSNTTPTLTWNPLNLGAGIDIVRYEVQVATNSGFSAGLVQYATADGSVTAQTLPVQSDGLKYWRVRAIYGVNTVGAWSSARTFTVDTVAPAATNLSSPANAALTSDTTPSLSWGSVTGANRYRVEIAVDENFSQAALPEAQVSSTSLTLASPGLAQGVYYWRVQAGDAADNWGGESAVRSFRLFVGTEPADGAFTTDTTPTFKWVGISGASGYRLEVATDSAFSSMVAGYPLDVGAVTSYTIPNNKALPAGDTYYWRILRRLPTLETPQADVFRTLFLVTTTPGAPVQTAPLNAAFLSNTTPTLTWNPLSLGAGIDIVRYEVQVATNSGFTSGVALYTTIDGSVTAQTLPVLPDGLKYWRVRGIYGVNTVGAWSSSRSFTVDTVAPGAPNLSSPANAALTSDTTPSLSWGSVSGANRYRVEVALDENFTQPALPEAQVTSTSLTLASPGLAQGVYYWRVQAGDAADNWGGESAVRSFRLFVGTEPADGAFTTDTTPTFKWTGISGASGYRLEVATDSAFSNMVAGYPLDVGAVTSYTIPNNKALPAGDTYYWRILRRLPTLETPQADVFRTLFLVTATPAPPVLADPANAAVLSNTTPMLDWNPVSLGAGIDIVRYEVQVATNSGFSAGLVQYATADGSVTAQTLPAQGEGLKYWRVRVIYGVNTVGAWSSARTFTVDTVAPGVPNLSSPANAALTSDTTPTLSWGSVTGANRYRVEVALDANFTQPALPEAQVTTTSLTLASPGLAQGVYYWRVQAGDAADNWGGESAVRSFRLFVGTEPADGAFTTDTTPTFKWVGISGASGYRLEVATDSAFSYMVAGYPLDVGAVTSYTIPNNKALPAGDTYYWRILRRLPTLETPQAGMYRMLMVVSGTPAAPVLAAPASGVTVNVATPLLDWNPVTVAAGIDVVRYEVQLATNSAFSSGVALYTTANGSLSEFTPPALSEGLKYWRVRAIYGVSTVGSWSSSRSFRVDLP